MKKIIPCILLSFFVTISSFATTYYISPNGSDANPGTIAQPWRTLSKVSGTTFAAGDQILFERGGIFRGTSNGKGGSAGNPLVWGAYGTGAKPKFLGSNTIGGWTSIGANKWTCNPGFAIFELFMNDKRQIWARYPNSGYLPIESSSGQSSITNSNLGSISPLTGGRVVVRKQNDWISQGQITGQSGSTINVNINGSPVANGKGFYVDKVLAAIDQAGEWFQNSSTFLITIQMPNGIDPNLQKFEGSVNDFGIDFFYNYHNRVQDIDFRYYKVNAIRVRNTSDFQILRCEFRNNNEAGLYMQGETGANPFSNIPSVDIVVDSCKFYDNNSEALQFEWFKNSSITRNIAKRNGIIAGYERDDLNSGMSFYITSLHNVEISYNIVDSSGYSNMVWNGSQVTIKNNIMSYNGLTKNDNGFVQTWGGKSQNNIIIDNIFHDGYGSSDGVQGANWNDKVGAAEGIYFDAFTRNNTITGNTVYNSKNGIFVQSSQNYLITNNTTYNCYWNGLMHHEFNESGSQDPKVHDSTWEGEVENVTTTGNIFYSVRPTQTCVRWSSDRCNSPLNFGISNNNYLFNPYSTNLFSKYRELCPGNENIGQNITQWRAFPGKESTSIYNSFAWSPYLVATVGGNLMANGSFDSNTSGWFGFGSGNTSNWEVNALLNGGTNKTSQTGGAADGFEIQSPSIAIQAGKKYLVSFSIVGNRDGYIKPVFKTKHPYYDLAYNAGLFFFNTQRSDYQFVITAPSPLTSGADYGIHFFTQANGDIVWLDNVSVFEISSISDDDYLNRSKLFVNTQTTNQTFNLGGNVYRDLDGNQVCGSITLAPFRSRILILDEAGLSPGTVTGSPLSVCSGQRVVLTVTGGPNNRIWQQSSDGTNWTSITGANTAIYTTTGITANTYFRVLYNSTVCPNFTSNSVLITLSGIVASVTGFENPICQGQKAVLSIAGVSSSNVLWRTSFNNGAVWTDAAGTNNLYTYTFNGVNAGNVLFIVSVNGLCGIINTPQVQLTVNSNANPAFSYGWPTCNNTQLNSSGFNNPATGFYATTNLGISLNSVSGIIDVSTVTGNVQITYTKYASGACPQSVTTTSVNLFAPPTINFQPSLTFCANIPFVITASGASSLQWALNGIPQATVTDIKTVAGIFSYPITAYESTTQCTNYSGLAVVTIVGNPLPTITGAASLTYCQNASSNATDITNKIIGTNILYYNSSVAGISTTTTGAAITTNAGTPAYTMWIAQKNNTCESPRLRFDININLSSIGNINPSGETAFCQGANVVLTSTSAINNQWYKNGQTISGATTRTLTVTTAGIYNLKVGAGLCSDTLSNGTKVSITPLPNISLSVSPTSQSVCTGSGATLSIANSEAGVVYQSYIGNNALGTSIVGTGSAITITVPSANLTLGGNNISIKASGQSALAGGLASVLAANSPVIDGNLTETGWAINKLINTNVNNSGGNPGDNTVTFGTLWDNTYLYVGVNVIDANLVFNPAVNFWDTDAIEIFVDGDNSKTANYDANDIQFILRYGDAGRAIWEKQDTGPLGTVSGSGVIYDYKTTANGYTMEIAIPWARIGIAPPAIGSSIGFEIANDDNDGGNSRWIQRVYASSAASNNSWETNQFGTMPLIGSQSFCAGLVTLTTTAAIQVNASPANPVFGYGNTRICNSNTFITNTFSGTGGGTFSATGGLPINSLTGTINVSGMAGNVYTINYIATAGCGTVLGSSTVTITSAPVTPSFTYGNSPFCSNQTTIPLGTNTGITGGSFSATNGFNINSAGLITVGTSVGVSVISYSVPAANGCGSVSGIAMITVDGANAAMTLNYGNTVCSTENARTFTGTNIAGGYFSYSTTGANTLAINTLTGIVAPNTSSIAGYNIVFTKYGTGACPNTSITSNLVINNTDVATFSFPSATICNLTGGVILPNRTGQTLGGTFSYTTSGSNTLAINNSTGEITPSISGTGFYTIIYQTSGVCAATHYNNISVTTNPATANFSFSGTSFCSNQNTTQASGNLQTLSVVSSTGGGTLVWADINQGIVNISASGQNQTYRIQNTITIAGCGSDTKYTDITINQTPILNIAVFPNNSICGGNNVTLSGSGASSLSWSNSIINNVGFVPAMTDTYIISGTTSGCAATKEATIYVTQPLATPMFNYGNTAHCNSAISVNVITTSGSFAGAYSSSLPINTLTGTVTINGFMGTHTITHTIPAQGACGVESNLTVITLTSAPSIPDFNYGAGLFCNNLTVIAPNLVSGVFDGYFSATNSLPINISTGEVSLGTLSGIYSITYTKTTTGICSSESSTKSITIDGINPTPSLVYASNTVCQNATSLSLVSALPSNSIFSYSTSGANVLALNTLSGIISPSVSSVGGYIITLTVPTTNACPSVATTTSIVINPVPVITITATSLSVCEGNSVTLTGFGADSYTWLPSNSTLNMLVVTPSNTSTITLNGTTSGCVDMAQITVTVNSIPNITIESDKSNNTVCAGQTFILTAKNAQNIVWEGSLNGKYTISTVAGGTFSVAGGTFNVADGIFNVENGTFSVAGTIINANTSTINVETSIINAETPTFSVTGTSLNGCKANNKINLVVLSLPGIPTGTNPNPVCQNDPAVTLVANGQNLKWYNTSISGTADNNLSTVATNNAGEFTRYVSQTIGNCESNDRLRLVTEIKLAPTLPNGLTYGTSAVCGDRNTNLNLENTTITSGFSAVSAGLNITNNGSIVFPTTFLGNASINYTASVAGCNPVSATINVSIDRPVSLVGISLSKTSFCKENTEIVSINGQNTGTFTASAGLNINQNNGTIDLTTNTKGSYTITYTIPNNGACSGKSSIAVINIVEPSPITISAANFKNEGICEQNAIAINLSNHQNDKIIWYQKTPIATDWVESTNLSTSATTFISDKLTETMQYKAVGILTACPNLSKTSNEVIANVSLKSLVGKATATDAQPEDAAAEVCPDAPSTEIGLDSYRGTIQWYEAFKKDTSNYVLIDAEKIPSAKTDKLTTPNDLLFDHQKYYKAVVTNGVCPAVTSNIVMIKTCIKNDFVPNALTPDANNENAYWDISKLKLADRATVKVFNRYGVDVFSSNGKDLKTTPWNGGGLPAGTYYYVIERNDGVTLTPIMGDLTIVK